MVTESDPTASYAYDYNSLGEATSITQSIAGLTLSVTLTQQFDAAGDRTQLAATIGGTADFVNNYSYDLLGEMTQVTQSGVDGGNAVAEKRVDFGYSSVGQLGSATRYADLAGTELVATGSYGYDQFGRLTSLAYSQGQTTLVNHGWSYDADGDVTQYVNSIDGTADYSYDATGQLLGASYSTSATAPPNESYTFDANGNRQTTAASTYTTGTDNQITSDGTYTYTYDADGNRTSRTSIANGSVTDYTWDYRNRLTEVTSKTSTGQITQQVEYAYDYQNRLVREVINPGTAAQQKTVYVYDGDQIVLEFDATANATNGDPPLSAANLTHRYLWAQAADQLLADEQVTSLTQPGNVLWALTDNLGTVRDLAQYNATTQTTSIVNHQVFSAFGQLESQTNLSNPQAAAVDCLFGFTGQLFDQATGLQNNLNRWYDPATGTWLSQDPKGFAAGDANLQRYVGNGATYQTDPMGLQVSGQMPPPPPANGYWYWNGSQWAQVPPAITCPAPPDVGPSPGKWAIPPSCDINMVTPLPTSPGGTVSVLPPTYKVQPPAGQGQPYTVTPPGYNIAAQPGPVQPPPYTVGPPNGRPYTVYPPVANLIPYQPPWVQPSPLPSGQTPSPNFSLPITQQIKNPLGLPSTPRDWLNNWGQSTLNPPLPNPLELPPSPSGSVPMGPLRIPFPGPFGGQGNLGIGPTNIPGGDWLNPGKLPSDIFKNWGIGITIGWGLPNNRTGDPRTSGQ